MTVTVRVCPSLVVNKDGHWTAEEHALFLKCWAQYGKSWKKLSEIMKTRTNEQIRTHAQKYFHKLRELRSVVESAAVC